MAIHLAVANRKGGVGKSTIAVMLAQGFAIWSRKRVLVVDLDTQCNSSLILIGGAGWLKAKNENTTIADYFYDLFDGEPVNARDYVVKGAGDVSDAKGAAPPLAVLPGSLLLEDIQGEIFLRQANQSKDPEIVGNRVRGRLELLLRRFEKDFDLVIYDCPPGLSFAALSALKTADKVLVPFRPDYVSQFAVDRICMLIEDKRSIDAVGEIPMPERRYVTIANCARSGGPDQIMIEEMAAMHPMLETRVPMKDSIARAFEWQPGRRSIEAKYGDGIDDVRRLHSEVARRIGM